MGRHAKQISLSHPNHRRRHRSRRPARWQRPAAAVTAALALATVVTFSAEAAVSGYEPPCDDPTPECTEERLEALEEFAEKQGQSSQGQPGTVTSTVTETSNSTATVTKAPSTSQSSAPASTAPQSTTSGAASSPAAAGSTAAAAAAPAVSPSSAELPYSPSSFFKSQVARAPVNQAMTQSFRSFMASHPDQAGTSYPLLRGVGGNRWGMVFAEGKASDPVWKLTGSVNKEVSVLASRGFHAPESLGSQLTGTSDSPFVVLDKASGWSIWASKARVVGPHTISVGSAGLYEHKSNGLDRRNPKSDSGANFRSRGAIPDAMVIRKDLMSKAIASGGDLGHVLHMFFVETSSAAGNVHPMVGSESGKSGWGAEGQRIAISQSVNLASRPCSPEGLVIARTLQRYGTYIGDNSGSGSGIKAQQDDASRSIWGSSLARDELKGCFTWNDMVVIEPGWQ
ncbi:MAG: hypothetical protein ACRDWY_12650 [Actinomycetes bacterium]